MEAPGCPYLGHELNAGENGCEDAQNVGVGLEVSGKVGCEDEGEDEGYDEVEEGEEGGEEGGAVGRQRCGGGCREVRRYGGGRFVWWRNGKEEQKEDES